MLLDTKCDLYKTAMSLYFVPASTSLFISFVTHWASSPVVLECTYRGRASDGFTATSLWGSLFLFFSISELDTASMSGVER